MVRVALVVAAAFATLIATACTSNATLPAPTPLATLEATPAVTPVATPLATPEAPPTVEVTAAPGASATPPSGSDGTITLWVIDGATGELVPIKEGERVLSLGGPTFEVGTPSLYPCEDDRTGADIAGRRHEGVQCGTFSPDGRWMTYPLPIAGSPRGDWDQWILDVPSGDRRLLVAGVRHCGGCDGGTGAGFSPDSAYLVIPELFNGGRVFLAHVASAETRLIAEGLGATGIARSPVWSSQGPRLLYSPDGARVVLEDLGEGTRVDVPDFQWPAAFDVTGQLIYSPAFDRRSSVAPSTTVIDASSLTPVAEVGGAPSFNLALISRPPIGLRDDGVVLALERAPGCIAGTTVYAPAIPEGRCFDNSIGAAVSADGSFVAMATHAPGTLDAGVPVRFDIIVFEIRTGEVRTVATEARSRFEPLIQWNREGTQILVVWPFAFGL